MKNKFLILLVVGLLAFNVGAEISKTDVNFSNLDTTSGIVSILRSKIDDINDELDRVGAGGHLGTGEIFYVDSGVGADTYDGKTRAKALATLDAAVAKCTANRGDVIYVMQGHAENLSAADGVDLDVAGITVKGLGNGTLRPTFTYTAAAGEFVIGAANIDVSGFRFLPATDTVTKAIDVEAAADYFRIADCEFNLSSTTRADEFTDMIIVNTGADWGTIEGNVMCASTCTVQTAISLATNTGTMIRSNIIQGDYGTACVEGLYRNNAVRIMGNTLFNGNMAGDGGLNAQPAIEFANNSSGLIANNLIAADVASGLLMRVFDDGVFMHNWITDDDGDEFGGSFENYAASVASHTDG